jgi:hypothetical protein
LDHRRNEFTTQELHPRVRNPTASQKILNAAYKSKRIFQTNKKIVLLRPQRKEDNSKNSKETAGDRNSSLGLLLERMLVILIIRGISQLDSKCKLTDVCVACS